MTPSTVYPATRCRSDFLFHLTTMNVIYHLAPAARWSTWPEDQPYLPSEFEREGFIHCTKGDELMVKVANQYQRKTPGDFVLLLVDVDRLDPCLLYTSPSPRD